MDALKAEDIHKSFGNLEVLKGVSLHVTEGEVPAILGLSGPGKSTLLRCATSLDYMDSGHIEYFGQITLTKENGVKTSKGDEKRFRHDYGLVFQSPNLLPHWTVTHNLCGAPTKVQKRPPEKVRAEAKCLLERMDLPDKGGAYPPELSGGQKQRVVIACALVLHLRMPYFGEPTSTLGSGLVGKVLAIIHPLAEEQMTIVTIIHEMEFAAGVADRAVFMGGDTVLEEGVADELIHRPTQECTKQLLSKLHGGARLH